jgi:Bacterial extracellular solute-binding protein
MARIVRLAALALMLAGAGTAGRAAEPPLSVRASRVLLTCATAAARVYTQGNVTVIPGGYKELAGADAFVGADVEITRALESGAAVLRSEVDIATVPWVLVVAGNNTLGLRTTADLSRTTSEVWVLGGLVGSSGRRALSGLDPERLKESEDPLALRAAAIALVPLSLAGSGERLATDVPPLVARAVVAEGTPHAQAATAFVRFLASEPGQRAFAACGSPQP